MTEDDYILIRDLSGLEFAQKALCDIVPANSKIVPHADLAAIQRLLAKWIQAHFAAATLKKE